MRFEDVDLGRSVVMVALSGRWIDAVGVEAPVVQVVRAAAGTYLVPILVGVADQLPPRTRETSVDLFVVEDGRHRQVVTGSPNQDPHRADGAARSAVVDSRVSEIVQLGTERRLPLPERMARQR